jgi:hypothetical protein
MSEPVPFVVTPVEPVIPEPVPSIIAPVRPAMPEPQPAIRPETDARSPRGFPKWILAGLAILLLSILMFNLKRKPDAAADIAPVIPASQAEIRPAAPPVVTEPPLARGMWHVIAFTFRSREMAAKKAKQINDKWPELHAGVFAPKGQRGYFLVALGEGMSREDATRVQRKARSRGLPRDTYVQNYSE